MRGKNNLGRNPKRGKRGGKGNGKRNFNDHQNGEPSGVQSNNTQSRTNQNMDNFQTRTNNSRGRGNNSHSRGKNGRGRGNNSKENGYHCQSSVNPQEQMEDFGDTSLEIPSMMTLGCIKCDKSYNHSERQPMVLWCGHTVCKACLQTLIKQKPQCSFCEQCFKDDIKCVEDACVNYAILAAVSVITKGNSDENNEQVDAEKSEQAASKKTSELDSFPNVDTRDLLTCKGCSKFYDSSKRLPRILECGHTFCFYCIQDHIKNVRKCPICNMPLSKIKGHNVITNGLLCELVRSLELSSAHGKRTECKAKEDESNGAIADDVKPIVDIVAPTGHSSSDDASLNNLVSSQKSTENNPSRSDRRDQEYKPNDTESHTEKLSVCQIDQSSTASSLGHDIGSIPDKSPHNSDCMKSAVNPTLHCKSCDKWVCEECGRIDHPKQRGCHLIIKKVALGQEKEAQVQGAKSVVENLDNTAVDLHLYGEQLDAFSLTMQAAFECITKEKARVEVMIKDCRAKKSNVEAAVLKLGKTHNLPGALSALQKLDDTSKDSLQWIESELSKTLDHSRVAQTTREILLSLVQMKILSEQENNAALMLMASQKVSENNLLSRMTVEGGRIFVHSLEKMDAVLKGARAIPLTSIKTCLSHSSALAFLDIGWNGHVEGRVTIRLMGDTIRGRQFLVMCTGETGSSYRNTAFHRIWWKGKPAEHIWGGDYSNRDGSGGAPVLEVSEREKSLLLAGRPLQICAGLVAGSFEMGDPSTIFRIYLKDDSQPVKKFSSTEVEEVKDNSAFGRVEYGLHFLDNAVKQCKISDIMIYECGVVIET